MINSKVENNILAIEIDTSIYNEAVICKTLYWYTADFIIYRCNGSLENVQKIEFKLKSDNPSFEWDKFIADLSDKLVDYKNRQIILEETKNLRELYFAKALSNNDSFIEFNFKD